MVLEKVLELLESPVLHLYLVVFAVAEDLLPVLLQVAVVPLVVQKAVLRTLLEEEQTLVVVLSKECSSGVQMSVEVQVMLGS